MWRGRLTLAKSSSSARGFYECACDPVTDRFPSAPAPTRVASGLGFARSRHLRGCCPYASRPSRSDFVISRSTSSSTRRPVAVK